MKRMTRSYKGIPLSAQEQSILSKDLHDFGKLTPRLLALFTSKKYDNMFKSYLTLRQEYGVNAKITEDKFEEIKREVNKVYTTAKKFAVTGGRLGKDPDFQEKFLKQTVPGYGLQSESPSDEIQDI